jgi:Glucose / Sorbosone dehydrogenase
VRLASAIPVLASVMFGLAAPPELTIEIKDHATMPLTGAIDGPGNSAGLLARINFLRQEPGGKRRLFVNDLNGPLYTLDKESHKTTTYLDLNGLTGHPGIFHRLAIDQLLASGFISFEFDPDYAHNGKFYTIHLEDPALPASNLPDNKNFPGFKTTGYAVSSAIHTFGTTEREAVLIEWTDTDISNTTFEGTAREVMRLEYSGRIHPMADLIFNPTARPGDPDWRVMYIATGDGGNGEQTTNVRSNPQRLDMLVGKILRIIPDLDEQVNRSTVSENGRYRIPNDNPFASKGGARKEIWAYGLRNPHRLAWDVDPANRTDHLIAFVIGLRTWETIDIIHKGANYGYSRREGPQQLNDDNSLSSPPAKDLIPVQIDATKTDGAVHPSYPVIAYGHNREIGIIAIANGFVYRGKAIPALQGKLLFGDITSGRLWWADMKEMLAVDDGDPKTMAEIHELKIAWNNNVYRSMAPIVEAAYHARGGKAEHLPGAERVPGGRSDIRLGVDTAGELYIMSKSDGMVRAVVGATSK